MNTELTKSALDIMMTNISNLSDKGIMNEGEYLEGARILKKAYNEMESEKVNDIKHFDYPIKIEYFNKIVDDMEILFQISGCNFESESSKLVKTFEIELTESGEPKIYIPRNSLRKYVSFMLKSIHTDAITVSVKDLLHEINIESVFKRIVKQTQMFYKYCYDDDDVELNSDSMIETVNTELCEIILDIIQFECSRNNITYRLCGM